MTNEQKNKYRHYVSTTLVDAINCFEFGAMTKEQFLGLVTYLESNVIDEKQTLFFGAIRNLIDKIEEALTGTT